MSQLPFHVATIHSISNGDMSQANIISDAYNVNEVISFCFQAIWSGSPEGVVVLEASINGTDFTEIDECRYTIETSPDTYMVNVEKHAYTFVRFKFTKTSGSGTLNVYFNSKRG